MRVFNNEPAFVNQAYLNVMKTIFRSYKFRIYPTKTQQELLSHHFGCVRFVYNHFLDLRNKNYKELNQKTTYFDCATKLTNMKKEDEFSWLKNVNSQSLQQSIRHLDVAFVSFFQKRTKFPRFKKKTDKQSFVVPQFFTLDSSLNKLYIPKFKEGIKINIHEKVKGKLKHVTVSKTSSGKYFASFSCEQEYQQYVPTGSSIGIDVGIKDLAVLSDGTKYRNVKALKRNLKKLKFKQRQVSKKIKGSSSRKKAIKQLALVHEKIMNVRRDNLHKVTTEIIKNHDVVCVESLAVIKMMKDHVLAQALSDSAFGEFFSMLEYKAEWNDKKIIKIDRWYPSSKNCSVCNTINQGLTLKDRKWTCRSCGTEHDRDINAARNILEQGLKILSGSGMESDVKQKQVEPPKKYLLRKPKGLSNKSGAMKPETPLLKQRGCSLV